MPCEAKIAHGEVTQLWMQELLEFKMNIGKHPTERQTDREREKKQKQKTTQKSEQETADRRSTPSITRHALRRIHL